MDEYPMDWSIKSIHVCMRVRVHVYTQTNTHTHTHTHTRPKIHMNTYIGTYGRVPHGLEHQDSGSDYMQEAHCNCQRQPVSSTCVYWCMYVCVWVRVCVRVRMCVCVCVCAKTQVWITCKKPTAIANGNL